MDRIELKEIVKRAIARKWDAFAADHPHLAGVIDQELLAEGATQSLADDPEYQRAMEQSHAVGIGIEAIISFVDRLVAEFLNRLL